MTATLANENVGGTQTQKNSQESAFTAKWLQENTMPIHGWLKLFLLLVTWNCGISLGIAIFGPSSEDMGFISKLPDIVLYSEFFILIFYMGWQFTARRANAVFHAKLCAIILFVLVLLSAIQWNANEEFYAAVYGDDSNYTFQHIFSIAYNIIHSVAFYIYLIFSEQVKELIPPSYRKVSVSDWIIVGVLVLLPIVATVITVVMI